MPTLSINVQHKLANALWKLYQRPQRPPLWQNGDNLPWNDPDFSQRMLREHLDESHGAASRTSPERRAQIDWLWQHLGLQPEMQLLDVTCGPGLYAVEFARRNCRVTGVDFSPASLDYANNLAHQTGQAERCTFIEEDVRDRSWEAERFDAALFLYGQLAVFPQEQAQQLLNQIAGALKPGGRLCIELLDQTQVDKTDSTWWFTDNNGLWGDAPFLHLGERFWNAELAISTERFTILHLETGKIDEITLCDQTYAVTTMCGMLQQAGFDTVTTYPKWDGLPIKDATEWVVYLAKK